MSVALTKQAVVERRKTVTRRLGWRFLKPGDTLTLCAKTRGLKKGEPLVRLAEVEVVSVRQERLNDITQQEVIREGFAPWGVGQFIFFFCRHMHVTPDTVVTRIEWRYLDEQEAT